MYAPPRRTRAPARATRRAVSKSCVSLSTVHGPAITTTSGPPISMPRVLTIVFSRRNVRLESLYGSLTRTTSCTPSKSSNSRVSIVSTCPTTPSTVWSEPVERWTSNPRLISSDITRSMFPSAVCFSIDDPLEETADGRAIQRTVAGVLHVMQDFLLAFRRIDGQAENAFNLADLDGVLGALVEQPDDHLVHAVDGVANAVDLAFSIVSIHKKSSSRRREEVIDPSAVERPFSATGRTRCPLARCRSRNKTSARRGGAS